MAILDSIKDPATGQIKKPVLYSLIGGVALVAFLLLKGKGTSGLASTGLTTPLTPDLTGLQDALKGLAAGGGTVAGGTSGSGSSGSGSSGSGSGSGSSGLPIISPPIRRDGGVPVSGKVTPTVVGSTTTIKQVTPTTYAGLTGITIIGSKKTLGGTAAVAASTTVKAPTPKPTVIGSKKVLSGTGAVAASTTKTTTAPLPLVKPGQASVAS